VPLLNFTSQFVSPIQARTKQHTIRAVRKQPIRVGQNLYLYCGLRRKGAFRILPEPVVCSRVESITIDATTMVRDGVPLTSVECERLAVADGFCSFGEMLDFLKTA
jgi:hypothetical protein